MADIVELQFEGGTIGIEVAPGEAATRGFGDEVAVRASKTFEEAMEGVRILAKGIHKTLYDVAPDALTVEFGLSIKGSGNFFIASGETLANVRVVMQWKKADPKN